MLVTSLSLFYPFILCNRKKDAVDVDSFTDYKSLVDQILNKEPNKLTIFVHLDDVKKSAKVCSYSPFQHVLVADSRVSMGRMSKLMIVMMGERVIVRMVIW